MEKNSKTKYSAISMAELGIVSVVLTPHENLEKILVEFKNEPDFIWAGGKGKKFLFESLYETLKHEDSVFTATPSIAKENPKRWVNFMDDCVIFAVLHSVVKGQPLRLLHPSCFTNPEPKMKLSIDMTEGLIPDLFSSIPCYQ
jgi:hypothetical protein